MMKIRIYQINEDRDANCVEFLSLSMLAAEQLEVDSEIYDLVYDGEVDCRDLEDVFQTFNIERPVRYRGHSMSISDVVEVIGEGGSAFWFCDTVGFKPVAFDSSITGSRMSHEK